MSTTFEERKNECKKAIDKSDGPIIAFYKAGKGFEGRLVINGGLPFTEEFSNALSAFQKELNAWYKECQDGTALEKNKKLWNETH